MTTAFVVAAVATATAVGLAVANPWGSRPSDIPLSAVKPGSEKERLLIRDQTQSYRSPAPPRGRPTEAWSPDVQPSIDESGESPFPQRADLVIINAWHGGLGADGSITSVYAGMEGTNALLIVVHTDLLTGLEVFHRELSLPGVTEPRITAADESTVRVRVASGNTFVLDLSTLSIRPA